MAEEVNEIKDIKGFNNSLIQRLNKNKENLEQESDKDIVKDEIPPVEEAVDDDVDSNNSNEVVNTEEPNTESVVDDSVDIYSEWDTDDQVSSEADEDSQIDFDFSAYSDILGNDFSDHEQVVSFLKDNFKNKDEVISEYLGSLPKELVEVIDFSLNGGDYKSMLQVNSIDYDSVSDEDLYISHYSQFFTDKDGVLDEEGFQNFLDSKSDADIRIDASTLRDSYKSSQSEAKNKILKSRQDKFQNDIKGISDALDKFSDVSGFKVSNSFKESTLKSAKSDSLFKDMFYTSGSLDYEKLVQNKFKIDNFDKITNFLANRVKNDTKRDVINSMSNVDVSTSQSAINVSEPSKNPLKDAQMSWIKNLKIKGNK